MSLYSSNHLNMWLYARLMIKSGYQAKTVMVESGLSYKQMNKLINYLRHEGSMPVQDATKNKKSHKQTASKIVKDHISKFQASVLMQIYAHISGDAYKLNINIQALNNAYSYYVSLLAELSGHGGSGTNGGINKPTITIDGSWVLANELRSGEAAIEICRSCNAQYFSSEHQSTTIDCPFCYISRKVTRPGRTKKVAANEELMEGIA